LKYRARHSETETSKIFGVSVSAIRTWQKLQKHSCKSVVTEFAK